MEPNIAENLEIIRAAISKGEQISGRPPGAVELVAVSKTHPPAVVQIAVQAGQLVFGESKVQEAKAKIPELASKLRWHLIGHLQSNKVRTALSLFEMIHSVDSEELLLQIQSYAKQLGVFPKLLLQVNVAAESSKFGFSPEKLFARLEDMLRMDRIEIAGLMTIPPLAESPEGSRKYFVQLRELRDRAEKAFGVLLPHLSMGMSADYRVAIEEGATIVRVGSAIFGERLNIASQL